tara:strand:- start:2570 stop:2929 length:360 start_codon:yes stop_codon:yes gene_type:complete
MSALKDVINLQKRQRSRYNELKQGILNKITDKISHLAKHGEMRCVYTVPSYVFGSPRYNVAEITVYLYYIFKKEGFCTVLLGNDKIFISWDINDINSLNSNKKKKDKILDIKPLININK